MMETSLSPRGLIWYKNMQREKRDMYIRCHGLPASQACRYKEDRLWHIASRIRARR